MAIVGEIHRLVGLGVEAGEIVSVGGDALARSIAELILGAAQEMVAENLSRADVERVVQERGLIIERILRGS